MNPTCVKIRLRSHRTNKKTRLGIAFLALMAVAVASGCVSVPKRNPLPQEFVLEAEVPGMPDVREWGDEPPPTADEWYETPREELRADHPGIFGREHHYLAISGGGSNGAFGAGLLVGWTEAGDRPEFTMVTGISTGALIAPFAFLGSDYDAPLREVYTTITTNDIAKKRSLLNTITSDAAASTEPLKELIEHYIDDSMIRAIGAEHRMGRVLLVGTTNLDAKRPVIWNLGKIAVSGHPTAAKLVRTVLLASASLPGIFPPVLIEVEADGQRFDEMHVDGGAASQVFLYPTGIDWDRVIEQLEVPGRPRVYVIRNSYLDPRWKEVNNKFTSITGASVSTLIRTQGIGDLYRIYLASLRDGLDFKLAYIPADFNEPSKEQFDPDYMGKLFDRGYRMAKDGYPWEQMPPDMEEAPIDE